MKVKKSYKLNTIVFALILIIVSAILLYITYNYIQDPIAIEICKSIAYSIITAALFTIIISIFERNHFEETLRTLLEKNLPFLDRLEKKGLEGFESGFPLKNDTYEENFIESETVTVVMNDGKRFFANNVELFRKRFNQSYKTTRFILLDPDAADSISVLTRKNDHEGDYYINKINDFIKELKKESINRYHKLEIYTQNLYTTMAVILMDDYAMISLYRISPGQDEVPHLVFKKNEYDNCDYEKIRKDAERLLKYGKIR